MLSAERRADQHYQEFAKGRAGHPVNENKQICHITSGHLTTGNRLTLLSAIMSE